MKLHRIRDLREEFDLSQKEVSVRLNISPRTYCHYENGTRQMPLEVIIRFAKLFNVSADYILEITAGNKQSSNKQSSNKQSSNKQSSNKQSSNKQNKQNIH